MQTEPYQRHFTERDNPYYFLPANQQKAGTKICSLIQCRVTVNEREWYILAGNDKTINSHCLTRKKFQQSIVTNDIATE